MVIILEIQDKNQDGIENCIKFDLSKAKDSCLFCKKMGKKFKFNELLLQLLYNVGLNSKNSLISILKCVQWNAFFKYTSIVGICHRLCLGILKDQLR